MSDFLTTPPATDTDSDPPEQILAVPADAGEPESAPETAAGPPSTAQLIEQAAQDGPVLVAFGARWSGPWRLLVEPLRRLEASGCARVIYVDVDAEPRLADRWAVVSVPTFVILTRDGQPRVRLGAVSPAELTADMVTRRPRERTANRRRS